VLENIFMNQNDLVGKDFGYGDKYGGKDWTYGSGLTRKVVEEIKKRCDASRQLTNQYEQDWLKMDYTLDAYMPADDWDNRVKDHDSRRPVTVVVPTTFSMREMYLTYMTKVFMRKDAIQRYRGMGSPKALVAGAMMERVNARQGLWFKEPLHLNTFWGDSFTYGRGICAVNWSKHKAQVGVQHKVTELMAMMLHQKGIKGYKADQIVRGVEERTLFEGSELQPIDLYQSFVDPNTPPNEFRKANFAGWVYRTTIQDIMRREADPEDTVFNAKIVRELIKNRPDCGKSTYWNTNSTRGRLGDTRWTEINGQLSDVVDVIVMCVDLIPSDWTAQTNSGDTTALSDSQYPERWVFEMTCDNVVIRADKLTYRHGMFPVINAAPNCKGHEALPVSHLFAVYAYQEFANWLMKSRMDAVNTVLNGLIFWDESKVEADDILNPGMGKLVRVKNSAFEQGGIDRFVHQMKIDDPTVGHMQNIMELGEMGRADLGLSQVDLANLAERTPAAGINAAQAGMFSRLDRIAMMIDFQAMQDLAWIKAFNTQEFMSEDVLVPIVGRYEQQLRRELGEDTDQSDMTVSPFDMDFNFEVVPYSSMLGDTNNPQAISEMIKTMLAVEGVAAQVATQYRIEDMIAWGFKSMGFEDIEEFRIPADQVQQQASVNMQTMPDEELLAQQQAGNVVSIGGVR
jgi:hypothetical protein